MVSGDLDRLVGFQSSIHCHEGVISHSLSGSLVPATLYPFTSFFLGGGGGGGGGSVPPD